VSAEAFTNLGNSLLRAYRLIEAYDCYTRALDYDNTNGIALTGAAKVLFWLAKAKRGDPKNLYAVAAKHLKRARENEDRIREIAGEQAYLSLRDFLHADIPVGELPDLTAATPYQRFVAQHRISLALTIEGLDLSLPRWDSIRIENISEPISAGHGVPPLFAMFNVLKSDFLTARYLAHLALSETIPESGNYSDSLDYACYGVRQSALTLAQRACLDLLDKVAVAASEYFGLNEDPRGIHFTRRWFATRKAGAPLRWQPPIEKAISLGNTALIAISELSGDLATGGFLVEKRTIRNASTHRFTILHDLGGKAERESIFVDHYSGDAFEKQLIETLQLTRAVLLYFVDMVAVHERLVSQEGVFGVPLIIPDHDWVRGEDR
jgi:tetratricopeptide (TPR) repeat protein